MAKKTASRRVNVFVNGKEVKDSVRDMEKEFQRLYRTTIKMTKGQKGYAENVRRLKQLRRTVKEHKKDIFDTSTTWDRVKKSVAGYAPALLAAFSIRGVASFFQNLKNETIELYDIQEKADEQLRTVIASTNAIAGKSYEDLKKQATELQGITLFGDEQTQKSQALLLTFTNIRGEIFDRSIPAIQDYSTAMALASGGTADLKGATTQLGKALNDPIKGISALGKAGVQFTEEQKEMIEGYVKSGDLAKAQIIILEEMETQFKGTAEAAAQAGTGQITQLNNAIGDLKEEIGGNLLPVQQLATRAQLEFYEVLGAGIKLFLGVKDASGQYIDSLREEQATTNSLVNRITDVNVSNDDRRKLIGELIKINPNFLAGLDREKVTNGQIAQRLKLVNEQYVNKIILEKEDARIQEQAEKVANSRIEAVQKSINAEKLFAEAQQLLRREVDLTGKSFEERKNTVLDALEEEAIFTTDLKDRRFESARGLNEESRKYLELAKNIKQLTQAQENQVEQENLLALAQEERAELLGQLGIDEDDFLPDPPEETSFVPAGTVDNSEFEEGVRQKIEALHKLQEQTDALEEGARISRLSKDEQEIEAVREKYATLIEEATLLEGQKGEVGQTAHEERIALERLRDEEVTALILEQNQAKADKLKELELLNGEEQREREALKREEELLYLEEKAAIELRVFEETASLQESAVENVRLQYEALIAEAEKYEIDTTAIVQKYEAEKAKARQKVEADKLKEDKATKATEAKSRHANFQATMQTFSAIGDGFSSLIEHVDSESAASAAFKKLIGAFQIGIDTALAISGAIAASQSVPFPANIAAIATSVATVLANVVKAKQLFSKEQVPQKVLGGFSKVTGADDGRQYNAQFLGSPSGGLLPSGPKLILANEAGPEYFIPNNLLGNPLVADSVRMIENIRIGNTPQRVEGGFSEGGGDIETAIAPAATPEDGQLTETIASLAALLARGINAIVPDKVILDIDERQNEIDDTYNPPE